MIPLQQPKPLSDTGGPPNSSTHINVNFAGSTTLAGLPDRNQDAMCELRKWAKELYEILDEQVPDLCGALMSRDIDEGKYYSKFYLDNDSWQQLKRFLEGYKKLLNRTDILNLLARIIEGEEGLK